MGLHERTDTRRMQMRAATAADAMSVAHLHTESWRSAYRDILSPDYLGAPVEREMRETWTSRLAEPRLFQKVILAEAGEEVLGFTCAFGAEDARWGTLIDNLHVRPDLKGRGLGSTLLGAAAAWSVEAFPDAGMHLWCFERNVRTVAFYRWRGGVIAERTTHKGPGGSLGLCLHFHWPEPRTQLPAG